MKNFTLLAVFCSIIANTYAQQAPENLTVSFAEKGFLENKGQVKDLSGKVNDKVKFIYSRNLFNLELKQNGFSYELFQAVPYNSRMDEAGHSHPADQGDEPSIRIAGSTRIDVVLEGASRNAQIEATDATGAYFNFYHSPVKTNRIEGVKAFNTVTYHNIYPGIDLVFSAPDEEQETPLHYDFIVHPGADPTVIQLKYNGNHSMTLHDNGTLQLNTAIGYIQEGKPFSFLQSGKKEILSAYLIEKNRVKYSIGEYDQSQTLVIDPTLIWGTYYGGDLAEDIAKVSVDSKKKPIIAGNTRSVSNIATTGSYQATFGGDPSDLFVAKFKLNGKLDWASYFGGTVLDLGYGAIADNGDNVILYGKAASAGLATVGQLIPGGAGDGIIAKFSPKGIFQWSTYKGGGGDDHYRNVRSDKQGDLYCTGYTESPNIATPGAYKTFYGGSGDCIISKFSAAGVQLWTTYFGAGGSDRFHALNLDLFGNMILQGTTSSTIGVTTLGAYQSVYGGGDEDVLLTKFDTSGFPIWSTYYGGEFSDRGRGVESDNDGNIYMTGLTESELGIATPGAHQENWTPAFKGTTRLEDGYVAKFNTMGQRVWGTYYGGGDYDRIWGMTLDRETEAIYVAGGTKSNNNISTPTGWQKNRISGGEGFFARWDYDGNLVWGSYCGRNSEEHLQDVESSGDGFIYVVGVTSQDRMPITTKVHQTESNGEDEALLYRFYAGIECYDYNEPNNDFAGAKLITGWEPHDTIFYGYNGNIVNGNDQDWYRFKVKAAKQNFMLILTEKTKPYSLKLYNAQQVLLQSSDNPASINDTVYINNAATGFYHFSVSHNASVFDSINCYRVKLYQNDTIFTPQIAGNKFSASEGELVTLKVFPNPASAQLSFSLSAPSSGKGTLLIYDLLGRIVNAEEISLEEGYQTLAIPLSALSPGSYRLLLKSNDKNWVASFIKQQ